MNGTNFFLDTNTLIAFFNGNKNVGKLLSKADFICISVISIIEFLAYKNMAEADKNLLLDFITEVEVIDVTSSKQLLIDTVIKIRKAYSIKLPDAIIAGTAIEMNCVLITADKDFDKIKELQVVNY